MRVREKVKTLDRITNEGSMDATKNWGHGHRFLRSNNGRVANSQHLKWSYKFEVNLFLILKALSRVVTYGNPTIQ
jgi:hypothetical protein